MREIKDLFFKRKMEEKMKKWMIFLFIFIFPCFLQAQTVRGNIYGKVVDTEGLPLPGVTLTLAGSMTTHISVITTPEGIFRFLTLPPANDYSIRATLKGFKPKLIENILVEFGKNVSITVTLEPGALSEEITVTAERPLIDKKKTEVGMVASEEVLQELPVTRDVWMIERLSPGVHARYWNVGGTESLTQDAGSARGDPDKYMTIYTMDGINVSDMSALGSVPGVLYYNYDTIEEMTVIVGGAADVTQQTSGVQSSVIMKRGGNKMTLGGRVYFTNKNLQGNNYNEELRAVGIQDMAKTNEIKDFGLYLGFPIIRDKAWFFLAFDNTEIRSVSVFQKEMNVNAWNADFKLNLQLIPQNRFETYYRTRKRTQYGDNQTADLPMGQYLGEVSPWGTGFIKIQDEHTFGDKLYVSATYVGMGRGKGGGRVSMEDLNRVKLAYWNVTKRMWENSATGSSGAGSYNDRFQFIAEYFNDKLFGLAHQIKVGGYIFQSGPGQSESGFSGNVLVRRNYNVPTVDLDGNGTPDIYPDIQRVEVMHGTYSGNKLDSYALFLQDTITYKNFNMSLGLRYDNQKPSIVGRNILAVKKDDPVWKQYFTPAATNAIDQILPAVKMADIKAYDADGKDYQWANVSPRFSFIWDINGNGKTVIKFSAATYYQWMSSGAGSTWAQGGTGGWMHFWWLDSNKDGKADITELYWNRSKTYSLYRAFDDAGSMIGDLKDASGIMYGAYDPLNPQKTTDPYTLVDGKSGAPRTIEYTFTFEKEIFRDCSIAISPVYRKYDKWNWDLLYFPATGQIESQDWYMSAGKPPANIPGVGDTKDAKNHEWYVLKPEYGYTNWTFRKPRPDYNVKYYGVDFIFTKRLSNRWMFNGSFTVGEQKTYYGDKGINNLTNKWAVDGREYTTVTGAQPTAFTPGRIDNPLWMVKAMALYQLPYGVDISFTFNAQEGRDTRETFAITDYSLPNPRSNSATLFMLPLGTEHSSSIALLNFRIQKKLSFEKMGVIVIGIDIFNVFNSSTILWRYPKDYGTYFVQNNTFTPNPSFNFAQDTLGARIARLGIRFTF